MDAIHNTSPATSGRSSGSGETEAVEATNRRATSPERKHCDNRLGTAVRWALEKVREVPQLRGKDLILARTETFANEHKQSENHVQLAVSQIDMIHPINRDTAEARTEERREAARAARALLEENQWVLTEKLIEDHAVLSPFKSITGVCVVRNGDRYFALEGNGRLAALKDVYPDLKLEVREFIYSEAHHAKLLRLIDRTRVANGTKTI